MRVGAPYCAFLSKHHGKIIMLWLLLVLVGAPLAQLFIGNCTNVFDAPKVSTRPCNTMWYPSTCAAIGFADVRAGTQMIVPPPPL